MTVLEQLRKTIEDGHPGETEKLVREALKQHIPAGRIVEEAMTPAMRTVGENYNPMVRILLKFWQQPEVCARVLNCWRNRTRSLAGGISEL